MNNDKIDKVVNLLLRDEDGALNDRIEVTLTANQAIVRASERERDEGTGVFMTLPELGEAIRRFEAR